MIPDAVVIGGGPAGAATAALLAGAGWQVVLLEQERFPRPKVCGEFVSPPTLPLLDRLGIGEEFAALAGPPVTELGVCCGDRVVTAPMPPGGGRALRRQHLDGLLLGAARRAGVLVLQPCKALRVTRLGPRLLCTVQLQGRSAMDIETRVVIAAQGSWNRASLPNSAPEACQAPGALLAFKAHYTGASQAPARMALLSFPGGYGGMVHADAGHLSLSCCLRRDVLAQCRQRVPAGQRAGDAVAAHVRAHCRDAGRALADARLHGSWLAAGPIRPGIRPRYRDRIFAVGNAAGEAHPVIAEGISMAVQGAWLLARELIRGRQEILQGGTDAVGARYARAWRRCFAPRIRTAAVVAHLAMHPAAARLFLSLFCSVPALFTRGAGLSGKRDRVPGFS